MTQHDRLLDLLRSYNGEWCPLPRILDLHIAQYGRVIDDLRKGKHGGKIYNIENKLLDVVNGQRHTAFRLIVDKPQQLTLGIEGKRFTNEHLVQS
jgi:hypothetical protein